MKAATGHARGDDAELLDDAEREVRYPGALDHLRAFHLQNRSGGTRTRTGDTMIFSHVRRVSDRFWRFQKPLIYAYFSNLTLLDVSGCCSGLL
jgi:hypothetical protein